MILFVLCSVILLPIQIYCELPSVDLGADDGDTLQHVLMNEIPLLTRPHTRRSPNPPENYSINQLAKQYLAWKILNAHHIPIPCDLFGNSKDERRTSDPNSVFLGEIPIAQEYSGIKLWNTFNLSGRRQVPLYAEEPSFVMRREKDQRKEFMQNPEEFIPQRGRKRNGIQDFLDKDDYFQPNRGKKSGNSNDHLSNIRKTEKKAKIQEVLNADLFFPNRGKKNWNAKNNYQNDESIVFPHNRIIDEFFNSPYKRSNLDLDDFFIPNRGKKEAKLDMMLDDNFVPNRGKKAQNFFSDNEFFPNRGKKADALFSDNEFFPNRGKKAENLFSDNEFFPNRGKKAIDLSIDDDFFPNRGKKAVDFLAGEDFFPNRGKKAEPTFSNDDFFPNRGKKENFLINDYERFMPNRGKKFNDILSQDDFVPNRGKKANDFLSTDEFFPNRGKKATDLFSNDEFFPNRGKKATQYATISAAKGMEKQNLKKITKDDSNMIVRRRRDLIYDMALKKDTHYLASGRQTNKNLQKSLNQTHKKLKHLKGVSRKPSM